MKKKQKDAESDHHSSDVRIESNTVHGKTSIIDIPVSLSKNKNIIQIQLKMMPKRKTLHKITGKAPLNLLSCCECESKKKENESVAYDYKDVPGFTWALEISCPDDSHSSFYIYTVCDKQRRRMTRKMQLKRHDKLHTCVPHSTILDTTNVARTESYQLSDNMPEDQTTRQLETIDTVETIDENTIPIDDEENYEDNIVIQK